MAQIPVFEGAQRLDAGNPVPISSSESARATGESISGFGTALFKLGDVLDTAAKKAKQLKDKYTVDIAGDNFKNEALVVSAKIASQGIQPGDDPSGASAIDRFNEALAPIKQKYLDNFDDETQKQAFLAAAGNTTNQYAHGLLANEVHKRELQIPILKQQSVMAKGALARQDPSTAEHSMLEMEHAFTTDPSISGADLPKMILSGKQQIAKEAIAGYIDRAKDPTVSADARGQIFDQARNELKQKFGLLFNADQLDKELKDVDNEEHTFNIREHQKIVQQEARDNLIAKNKDKDASKQYTAALSTAGNDQNKIDAILKRVELDPNLSPESKIRLTRLDAFSKIADRKQEISYMTDLYQTRDYDGTLEAAFTDWQKGKLSDEGLQRVEKNIQTQREFFLRSPGSRLAVSRGDNEIKSWGKGARQDPATGQWSFGVDPDVEALRQRYADGVQKLASSGKLDDTHLNELMATIRDAHAGSAPGISTTGIPADAIKSLKGIQDYRNSLALEYKSNPAMTKERQDQIKSQLIELKNVESKLAPKEGVKLNNDKIYDN